MSFVEVLRDTEVFKRLTEDRLRRVAALCARSTYEAGAMVARQGDEVRKLYIVEEGMVQFQIEIGPGRSWSVDSSGRGECFGWAGLIDPPLPWASTGRCAEDTILTEVDIGGLKKLCESEYYIGYAVMLGVATLVANRLQHTRIQVVHLAEKM